jgi:CelD/BcsL family acetyltransferase involved in cellulose biosynthesis
VITAGIPTRPQPAPFLVAGERSLRGGGAVTVETITDVSRFDALRDEWNALLEASATDCLFLTWEWLSTWWRHLSGARRLRLILVRQAGELIAIAPLCVSPPRIRRLIPFRILEFLGTGSIGSDYLDMIVKEGREAEAIGALADRLAKERFVLDLAQIDRRSSLAALVGERLTTRGWTLIERVGDVCPFIPLAGRTWEAYLASLHGKHRSNFTRRDRALAERADTRLARVKSEGEREPALQAMIQLHQQRWQDRGGSDALHTSGLLAFHDEFTRLALARDWLRLFVLHVAEKPVAALYGFSYRGKFLFYQTGFDPEYSRHGVGQVTVGRVIKDAFGEGLGEFDFLHGDESYKFDWTKTVRQLARLELYGPGLRGWVQRAVAELGRRLRGIARRVLPRPLVLRLVGGR